MGEKSCAQLMEKNSSAIFVNYVFLNAMFKTFLCPRINVFVVVFVYCRPMEMFAAIIVPVHVTVP